MRIARQRLIYFVRASTVVTLALLATLMPWETIRNSSFIDRENYVDEFLFSPVRIPSTSLEHWYSYITNEYLWNTGIKWLVADHGVSIELIFSGISLLLFSVAATLVIRGRAVWSCLLLLNPLFIDLAVSQYRSALALALLGLTMLHRRFWLTVACLIMAPLIHTASVLFILMYLFVDRAWSIAGKREWGKVALISILVFGGIFASLVVGPYRGVILSYFGDRRVDYPEMASSFSFLLFWVALLPVFALQNAKYLEDWRARYSLLLLALIATNMVTGGYSTRFLAAGLPFLIISMLRLKPPLLKICVLCGYVFYSCLQWSYWLGLNS